MSEHITDDIQATRAENRLTARILAVTLIVLVLAGVSVAVFGLPMLGILGLVGTAAVFVIMLLFTLGN